MNLYVNGFPYENFIIPLMYNLVLWNRFLMKKQYKPMNVTLILINSDFLINQIKADLNCNPLRKLLKKPAPYHRAILLGYIKFPPYCLKLSWKLEQNDKETHIMKCFFAIAALISDDRAQVNPLQIRFNQKIYQTLKNL